MSRRRHGPAARPGGVRVLGGRWRGRRLAVPMGVRPTQGRVREALFSRWGDRVAGSRLLELYAGSAAVSFEALSRGAAFALAVDRSAGAHACIEANRQALGTDDLKRARTGLPAGLARALGGEAAFDLVFIDPPYEAGGIGEVLAAASTVVAAGGEVVLEHSSRRCPPPVAGRLELRGIRRYGDSALGLYR